MGNSSSEETRYTYEDNTDEERRRAKEREARRLENKRKQFEKEERERIEKEKQQEEERHREKLGLKRQKDIEEEEKRREEDERKRLELEAELPQLRRQLKNYKFGDKIKLDSFLGLEIDDVTQLRIGVFGSAGTGKSCFINTVERVVRQTNKGSVPDQSKGEEGTIVLQDYLPELFFHLVDTRGFFIYDSDDVIEFQNVLSGKFQPGDIIVRPKKGQVNKQEMHQCPKFGQRLHGAIIVVKGTDPRLAEGALRDYWNPLRSILCKSGIAPITVVTHCDDLKSEKEKEEALEDAYKATSSSPSNTFLTWNYTKDNTERNPEIERMTFDILHYALITAEKAVKQMKSRERNEREDDMMRALEGMSVSGPDSPDALVEVFLRFLQKEYRWDTTNIVRISHQLVKDDVTTVNLLAKCWSHVQHFFPVGMSRIIEKELRKRGMLTRTIWPSQAT